MFWGFLWSKFTNSRLFFSVGVVCLVSDTETITNLTYENGNDMSNILRLFVALLLRLHLRFRGWTLLSTDIDSG